MNYYLVISCNGRHLATTKPNHMREAEAFKLLDLFRERFLEADGYRVELNREVKYMEHIA